VVLRFMQVTEASQAEHYLGDPVHVLLKHDEESIRD
jgi:hypothetical protein